MRLGFDSIGVSKAEFLENEAPRLESWLKSGFHGQMSYMENHFDKRLDPTRLVPGAQSVISLTYNYFPKEFQREDSYKLSKYAYGEDYHRVVKDKLRDLVAAMRERLGSFHARVFTDSAPIMERSWAQRSGLGWIGKHSLLISKSKGSYFFLAEIIADLEQGVRTWMKPWNACSRTSTGRPSAVTIGAWSGAMAHVIRVRA